MKWRRPEHVAVPTVWRRFEGAKPFPNGKKPRFRVQDLTEDLVEAALDNMTNMFLRDEPLCECLNLRADEDAVRDMIDMWRGYIDQKTVLVCLLENKEELEDDTLPLLVGCNMTGVLDSEKSTSEYRSKLTKKVCDLLDYCDSFVDYFKHYGVSEFLYAMGLSVDRRFRGQGIGLEILKARYDMGRALGLKLTVTAFTAISSQILAERAGFETLFELPYEEYKVEGEVVFKNIKSCKSVKIMAARIG